jgi:hypothetical protein
MTTGSEQRAVSEVLARMDEGWNDFRDRVQALPGEELEARIGDGAWTRKQMLGHITTWHELTVDRLAGLMASGAPPQFDEDEDVVNARAARAATGRTSGEVLRSMEDSFGRLRREVSKLTDEQLVANDGFAAKVIEGNSYGHYREHLTDVGAEPEPQAGAETST